MKYFNSIRYKFLFSIIIIFLIFVNIVLYIWYTTLKSEAESTAINNMKTIINVSNTSFENEVKDIINVAALTTVRSSNDLSNNIINILSNNDLTDAEIVSYRNEAQDYLISLCNFKKHLNGLMLSDYNRNNITYGIMTDYNIIFKENWLERLDSTDSQTIFIEPHYSNKWYQYKNDLVFSVLRPIYDFSNKKIGFAMADINCNLFNDSFDVNPTNQSVLYVIDDQTGKVIFTPNKDLLHLEDETFLSDDILQKLDNTSSTDFIVKINNTKMLVVSNKSELTGWTTLSVIPEKDIVSSFSTAAKNVFITTVILVIVLVICVFVIASLLTNNIIKLTNAVKKVDGSNLALDIAITSKDEIGALALQFQSMISRITQLLTEVKQVESAKRSAEISALQFQMNPHFLYNSLNTIKFLATLQGADNIENVAESLSCLMHINMDGRSFITVGEDISFIESYLSIQNYRHTNIFHYNIKADPDVMKYMIPKLFIQPLVENIFKHAITQKTTGGIILLCYYIEDITLRIRVEDNGAGISEERIQEILSANQNDSAGHIGIYNIQERINLYFGDQYGIQVESQPGVYTRFEITIPLITEKEMDLYAQNIIGR